MGIGLLVVPIEAMATTRDGLPVLYGLELTPGAVTVHVVSNGCTEPEDFMIEFSQTNGGTELIVSRIREDHCRMAPHIVELSLDLPQNFDPAGASAQIKLINPLSFPGALFRRK